MPLKVMVDELVNPVNYLWRKHVIELSLTKFYVCFLQCHKCKAQRGSNSLLSRDG